VVDLEDRHRVELRHPLRGQWPPAGARPPRRYEIAAHLHHLASIAHASGSPAEAERLYRQALELKREVLGDDHPEVALVAHDLGTLLADPLDRPARAV
jgi:hypothetical protein